METGNSTREIIAFSPALSNGGAERVLSELVNAWADLGCKVTLVELRGKKDDVNRYPLSEKVEFIGPEQVSTIGLPWADSPRADRPQIGSPQGGSQNGAGHARHALPTRLARLIRPVIEIARIVELAKSHPNAVIVALNASSVIKCAFASLFVDNRTVFSERGDPRQQPSNLVGRILKRWALPLADHVVFQTDFVRGFYPGSVRIKSTVIPNPIRPDIPEPFEGARSHRIVAACRLEKQKNLPMLLRAFARFAEGHPYHTLVVYGTGSEQASLEKLAAELGIQDKVSLPGFAVDVNERMVDAAMFVSTSNHEGISNSMLEALAMGLPAVVTDCPVGGAAQSITNDVSGLLVPVGDEEAFARAMERVADEPGLAERLGKEAARIRQRFPQEAIARRWLEVLFPNP